MSSKKQLQAKTQGRQSLQEADPRTQERQGKQGTKVTAGKEKTRCTDCAVRVMSWTHN
jgi:hypothetical protein